MSAWLESVSAFVWGPVFLIPLLVGTGLYLTALLRGLQFKELGPALWLALIHRRERGGEGDISHFQALMTALAATVGTGNIAGVATAIAAGGPGALFWMWMTGLVGMATKYAEALLSVRYREVDEHGHMAGGPMYFLARGLPWPRVGRLLGASFAGFAAVAAFGIGNGVQSREVGNALHTTFGFHPTGVSAVLALLVAAVLVGGVRWIARAASMIVPTMILLYSVAALVILIANVCYIPAAFAAVMSAAISPEAFGGGLLGASVAAAIRFGVARGIFSNESGLGSAGIAAAAAATREPVRQALVSMTQTFIDTLVICTLTGLVILTTVLRDVERVGEVEASSLESAVVRLEEGRLSGGLDPLSRSFLDDVRREAPDLAPVAPLARWRTAKGSEWTTLAFRESLPGNFGGTIVSIGLALFAFSTMLGWGYYGEKSLQYLGGVRVVMPYRVLFAAMVLVGPLVFGSEIWLVSDITNGLMAIPNLIGLLLLSGVVAAETRAYLSRRDVGGERPLTD
jgi:AGCS family alanine or glycine:cation symporter